MKDNEHPFFRPLWRRIALVAGCAGWAVLEYVGGSPTWSMIALAFTGYGAWQFLYAYKRAEDPLPQPAPEKGDGPKDSEN